jgi:hypothetical protein
MKVLRLIPYAVLFGYVGAAAVGLVVLLALRSDGGVGPDQPIAFSHQIHAADLALDCTHCHQTVEVSRFPGIPSTDVCMVCHEFTATDRPDIQRLTRLHNEGRPVEWIKVHSVPWHVYFTHKRHIKAEIECTACHSDVTVQLPVRQVRSFDMGMCVNCHRANGAPTDCWTCHK